MLNRRDMLRLGLVGSGITMLPGGKALATPSIKLLDDLPASPPTTPFLAALPTPPTATTVNAFMSECTLPSQSNTSQLRYFRLITEERFVQAHPQLPPTKFWGYRDANVPAGSWNFALGPTFKERQLRPVIVRHENNLPVNHTGFGVTTTTVHLHGGHHPARSDGFPGEIPGFNPLFGPGQHFDYCYPLLDPGFLRGMPEDTERPATMWYHDHRIDFTAQNVYRGLAGMFLVFDALDAGNENLNDGVNLRLPSGDFDVPLVLQDKRFDGAGQLVYDVFNHDGFLGDKFLVNGAIQPFFNVKRRKYRFRLLDASNARFYQVFLTKSSGQTFTFDQIATDGGLLSETIRGLQSIFLGSAQRADIVIDFSTFNQGDVLYLENRLRQDDGRGPNGTMNPGVKLLKFIVGALPATPDTSLVPNMLRPFPAITAAMIAAATRRTFVFKRRHGAWVTNEQFVDLNVPQAVVPENSREIWTLINNGGGWWHPIHIHLEYMRVLKRNGQTPPLNERDGRAKKDIVNLGPNESVEAFFHFRDYPGPFVFHCHNVEHEDMFMMARYDVS